MPEPPLNATVVERVLAPIASPKFPDYTANYLKTVVEPAEAARAAEKARLEQEAADEAAAAQAALYVPPAPVYYYTPPAPVIVQAVTPSGGLTGSYGYAIMGGNCVNQIPASIRPNGNPIEWAVTSYQPYIGAVALFGYNHTGIVSGIWSNGDVEIRHENWNGAAQTRFPRGNFRGFR